MKKGSPNTIYLKDYTPPPFFIEDVALEFQLGEEATLVYSTLVMRRNPDSHVEDGLVLDGEQLELLSLKLDGVSLSKRQYHWDRGCLEIPQVPQRFILEIVTRIKPQENTSLEGLYKSSGNFCTQCEAEGFRKITYFLDRSDVMATYTTTIVADRDKYPVLLSNGNLIYSGELNDNRHYATWRDPFPKPSYLFALVAGDLVCDEGAYRTQSGREVALRIYVQEHNIDKCGHAMDSLKKAMSWDERTFGLEYDLDIYMIVAVDDFNMGAMENKGLNVFNSKFVLARPDTATDMDYAGIEGVIAHEYFHNWTGNRVTCRDWFQLSLKEGLTVFRDQKFSADMGSRAVKRINDVRLLRTYQFAEDASPMAHPVRPQSYMEINNFYTVTVYEKGAEVVRMYHTLFGEEGFRKGMDLYLQRHDGQAVTTDDFAAAMADANQADLSQFKRWYDQAGTPEISVRAEWNPDRCSFSLDITQDCAPSPGQDHKEPFHIPLRLGLLASDGSDIPLQLTDEAQHGGLSRILELRDKRQSFEFVNVPEKPVPSLFRGFSAPVNLRYEYSNDELAFLLAHDSDPFNRWEAGQKFAIDRIKMLIEQYQGKRNLEVGDDFAAAFKNTLMDPELDKAFIAEVMTLPSETYIGELIEQVDVDAIHAARQSLRRSVAADLESILLQTYKSNQTEGSYRYNAADAGRRRLINLCLTYLTTLDKREYRSLAMQQFKLANNMTDSIGAMQSLIDCEGVEREEVLRTFHDRWQQDTLVMDKWFTIQALSCGEGTLDRVRQLLEHPLFSIRNPNKVRALIGTFAHNNPIQFHRVDGAGYEFIADRVLQLDSINPQVAARLVRAFSRWRRYESNRRTLMQMQLERIMGTSGLSKDVYEIVSKSLV
jgi:aminopeptidase N